MQGKRLPAHGKRWMSDEALTAPHRGAGDASRQAAVLEDPGY
jgi:hypothetical protein